MFAPKVPKAETPKLAPVPVLKQQAADFNPATDGNGFGKTGRSGGSRGLRIKRRGQQNSFGNLFGATGISAGSTQVPGV